MRAPLLLLLATIASATMLAACDDAGEDVADDASPSATAATPTAPVATSPSGTLAPTKTPTPGIEPPLPSGWTSYTDSVLGFSLSYPTDLAVTEKVPSDSERDLEFRAFEDPPRLVLVVAMVENRRGLTLDQWVLEYAACLPETIEEGFVAGKSARLCTSEPAQVPEAAVAFEHGGTMFLIRSLMHPSDFELIIASLRL